MTTGVSHFHRPRLRGFFIGVGTLLRSVEWKVDTFALGDFEKSGCPAKPIRCAYYARHFYNWYHMASEEELTRLTEDLALWGVNALTYQFTYPVKAKHPEAETCISTWTFHDDEFKMLYDYCLNEATKAEALAAELEQALPQARRNYWRWRHLRLRTIIDRESSQPATGTLRLPTSATANS